MTRITIFTLLISLYCSTLNAKSTYYISPSGNDASSGLSAAHAWKTIAKLNTLKNTWVAGDSILFQRDATFYGTLEIAKSGTVSEPIYIGAYGTGARPILSGSEVLATWTNTGSNIWTCNYTSTVSRINNLLVDGKTQQIARYPDFNNTDGGFLPMYSCQGDSAFINSSLTSTPNYVGAEAVIRTNRWIIDRKKIKTHLNTSILLAEKATYNLINGYGFFIQNHPSALSLENEWCYDSNTKKVYLYAAGYNPSTKNIEISTLDYLVRVDGRSNIKIENIQFDNSNLCSVYFSYTSKINMSDCVISNAGTKGVLFYKSSEIVFEKNLVYDCNSYGVDIQGDYSAIKNNDIRRIGIRQGMGESGNGTYNGLNLTSRAGLVQYNTIDSIGYAGITYGKDSMRVANNVIKNVCLSKDDGGAIYAWNNSNQTVFTKIEIENNIIVSAIGNGFGTDEPLSTSAEGIYCDDAMNHVTVKGNTVTGATHYGLYLHNNYSMTVEDNIFYGNNTQAYMKHDNLSINNPLRNIVFRNNTLVNTNESQRLLHIQTRRNDLDSIGTFSANYYVAPYKDSFFKNIYTQYVPGFPATTTSLSKMYFAETWFANSGKDADSKLSPAFYKMYEITNYKSANKITNSDFASNILNWTSWGSNGSTIKWVANGIEGGSISLSFPTTSTSSYVELNTPVGELKLNEYYRISFKAKATKPNTRIEIRFLTNGNPYTLSTLIENVPIPTTAQDIEYVFKSPLTDSNSRITFRLYSKDSLLMLDNIQLQNVDITNNNIADSLQLLTNETVSNKSVALSKSYVDLLNIDFDNSVLIPAYSSKVLFDKSTSDSTNSVVTNNSFNIKAYPSIFVSGGTLYYTTVHGVNPTIRIFNLMGNLVFTKNNLVDSGTIVLPNLSNGIYLVEISTDAQRQLKKIIVK